jgi:single-strand DNA-binding protein
MNKTIYIGRLTADPEVRYAKDLCIARYTLAVDRKYKKDGEPSADFIRCVAFGKNGEFAEKYLKKGTKIAVTGRTQTWSYKDKDGKTVYTNDNVVEEHEFCESKGNGQSKPKPKEEDNGMDGFMDIPDGIDDAELPFA